LETGRPGDSLDKGPLRFSDKKPEFGGGLPGDFSDYALLAALLMK
jgi:hypothetical protein